ncbi:MAG: hypothetical protein SH847_15690 [Roseiflexaceae bacterium]|nr:hypothetical protein [Roseiflexaceae bacterium]
MTLLAEPILSAETAERYEVIDPTAVRAYLASRPALANVLEDAPQQIARFFPDAPLRLEGRAGVPRIVLHRCPCSSQRRGEPRVRPHWASGRTHRGQTQVCPYRMMCSTMYCQC